MRRFCYSIMILVLAVRTAGPVRGALLRVPGDYAGIQPAIDASQGGDTILVAPGEYVITEPITFRGKAITVRSEAGRDETTIRMGTPANPDRGSVVIFESGETAASVLDGFAITGGTGSWLPSESAWVGGGIYLDGSSGTAMNCCVRQNRAFGGGGGVMVWSGSSLTVIDCEILRNTAKNGGGVMIFSESSITMANCVIRGNSATGDTPYVAGYGGGLCCLESSLLTLTDCSVVKNSAGIGSGGIQCSSNCLLTLANCTIVGNSAVVVGGGMFCEIDSSVSMTNCAVGGNSAIGKSGTFPVHARGGGIACWGNTSLTLANCTITGNSSSEEAGGVICDFWCSGAATNSIIWGNTAPMAPDISLILGSVLGITYSDVAGGRTALHVDDSSTFDWAEGNINADPLFAKPGYWGDINDPNMVVEPDDPNAMWVDGDYHLKSEAGRWDSNSQSWVMDDATSPCIDRGDRSSPVGDEPDPNGGLVNMGAYGGTREASMSIGMLAPWPPLAYWKLDETEGDIAYDSVGSNHGTVIGVPTWQPDGGQMNGALEFNGATFVVVGPVLNPSDGPFSVFAWIKGGQAGQAIVSQQTGVNWLMLDPATGGLMTELRTNSRGSMPLSSNAAVADDDWHHIGFAWDGSRRSLYMDDVLVAEDEKSGLAGSSGGLTIGCGADGAPDTFFTGLIDEVRIYNRAVRP